MAAEVFSRRKTRRQRSFWQDFKRVKFSKLINNLLAAVTVIIMAVASCLSAVYYVKSLESYSVPVSIQFENPAHFQYSRFKWREVLFAGIPGLSYSIEETIPIKIPKEPLAISAGKVFNRFILLFTNTDINDKHSLLAQEIPLFASFEKNTFVVPAGSANSAGSGTAKGTDSNSLSQDKKNSVRAVKLSDKPLVGIYHTHSAESFIPASGVSHKMGGQLGDINIVGEALVQGLEERGVIAIHSQAIHDYPSFMKAYGSSVITAEKMLADNPTIQMIFDIHRDAGKRENSVININGLEAAKISIIVAQGQEDLPQPLWLQNHAFAKLIDDKLSNRYPGLSKGIQLSEWRYNQHLHPRALLIEVGCQENGLEEAIYSMQLLAEVLVEILKENK